MASKKLTEGGAIINDFENLLRTHPPEPCSCSSPALCRVIWTFKMVDILRLSRRFNDPVVLAVEFRQQGTRLFMTTSRKHVFHYLCYLRIHRPELPTWNEVMSGLTPLRLYFDLDFYYATNPNVNAMNLLERFRRLICRLLIEHFQWRNGEEDKLKFIELDATSNDKFSRHIMVHIYDVGGKEITFENASKVRDFVQNSILPALKTGGFYIQPKPGVRSLDDEGSPIVDLSVYGDKAGQNFRLLGSPKFGRDNVLHLLHSQHAFRFHDPSCLECKYAFLDSLATATTKPQRLNESMWRELVIAYRRDVESSDLDMDFYGIKCGFYHEICLFNNAEKLFRSTVLGNLLTDVRQLTHCSQFYDILPNDRKLVKIINLFRKFKSALCIDPVDWDEVWSYAADLFETFHVASTNDNEVSDEESVLDQSGADSNTVRRLRVVYAKFSKWKEASPSDFFTKDFDKAKKMYDSYMATLMKSTKSVIPAQFPVILTKHNFQLIYELLADVEKSELERRYLKKCTAERRIVELQEALRQRIQEERDFISFVENLEKKVENFNYLTTIYAKSWASYLIDQFEERIEA